MKINQISVFLENKPGALKDVCRLLADNQIDISTMSMADTKDFGILRLIVKDWEKAADVLKKNGLAVTVTGVVALEVENRPGGMCQITRWTIIPSMWNISMLLFRTSTDAPWSFCVSMRRTWQWNGFPPTMRSVLSNRRIFLRQNKKKTFSPLANMLKHAILQKGRI